jgi:ribosomal protein S18 acetylase RimI-like enzyme
MRIVPLHPDHTDALYRLYRQVTAHAAHCRFYPGLPHFAQALAHPHVEGTRVLVAEDAGSIAGFASVTGTTVAGDGVPEAQVTALFVAEEQPGLLLLDACQDAALDAKRILAFPASHERCPIRSYNAGWDALSDRIAVVGRVLARAGFVPTFRELHLECPASRMPRTPTPAPQDVTIIERDDGPDHWSIVATVDDQEVGVCVYNTLAHLTDHPDAGRWGYVGWLHVAEGLRRRGLARHLLTRALRRLQDRGCDGCWLTTGADNWPAQPLYLALGFEIVDASASFKKELRRS